MRRLVFTFDNFTGLPEAEKAAAVREFARDALRAPNGEVKLVDAKIRQFECRYEMTSERMEALVAQGKYNETADIASWLIALDLKRRLVARQARP